MEEPQERKSDSGKPDHFGRLLLAVLFVQVLLLIISQRSEIGRWTERPFLNADYGYHYYFDTRQAESIRSGVGNAAYDPGIFGGMEIWSQVTPSDRLTISLLAHSPESWWPAVFNLHFLVMFLTMPILFLLSVRRFGLNPTLIPWAAIVAIILFWAGMPPFIGRGISTFPFSMFLAVWLASEVYALSKRFSHWRAGLVALATAILAYIHPAGFLVFVALAVTVIVHRWRSFDRRILGWAGVAAMATVAVNLPWYLVAKLFAKNAIATSTALTFSSLSELWQYHFGQHGLVGLRIFAPVLLVLLTWRFVFRRPDRSSLALYAWVWTIFFALLYTFGSFMPFVKLMQPRRFNVGLKIAAAIYLLELLGLMAGSACAAALVRPGRFRAIGIALGLGLSSYLAFISSVGKTLAGDPLMSVVALLQDETKLGSRIYLIRGPHDDVTPETDEECILGSFLDREFLGTEQIVPTLSRYGNSNVARRVGLVQGTAGIQEWREFRDLWELQYVLFPARFEHLYRHWMEGMTPVGDAGGYRLYRVDRAESDRFIVGRGQVRAGLNQMELSDVQPGPEGVVVLAYHYSTGLASPDAPGLVIRRRIIPGDDLGLVEISHPPRSFHLVFDLDAARRNILK